MGRNHSSLTQVSGRVTESRDVRLEKKSFQRRKEGTYLTKGIVHNLRWLVHIGKVNSTMISEKRSMKFFKSYPILPTAKFIVKLTNYHFHVVGV